MRNWEVMQMQKRKMQKIKQKCEDFMQTKNLHNEDAFSLRRSSVGFPIVFRFLVLGSLHGELVNIRKHECGRGGDVR